MPDPKKTGGKSPPFKKWIYKIFGIKKMPEKQPTIETFSSSNPKNSSPMPDSQLFQPLQTLRVPKGSKYIVSNVDVLIYLSQDSELRFVSTQAGNTLTNILIKLDLRITTDPNMPSVWTQQDSAEFTIQEVELNPGYWYFVSVDVYVDGKLKDGGVTNTINNNGDINYPG